MRKFFRFGLICLLIYQFFGLSLILSPQKAQATAFTITESAISTNAADQWSPKIYGSKIVWMDLRHFPPTMDYYVYDLATSTETLIASCTDFGDAVEIYGDVMTWAQDDGGGDWNIYMYNLATSTKTQITDELAPFEQVTPNIYGNKIVWQDNRNGNYDIYMYDIDTATETKISNDPSNFYTPAIYQDKIVYSNDRNGKDDIYLYNLTSHIETRITTDPEFQWVPRIYDNIIVWQDTRNGIFNSDIYMYNLTTLTETPVATAPQQQRDPDIYGNKIVWDDDRNMINPGTEMDIYMYDLSTATETRLTPSGSNQGFPDIYDNKIVFEDDRNSPPQTYDIYMATLNYSSSSNTSGIRFENLPGLSSPVNLEDGQTIDTPTYTLQIKPYSKAGIEKVEFYVDNNLICTDTSADANGIYTCDWDTTKYHSTVKIIAYTKNGHQSIIERTVEIAGAVSEVTITELPKTGADLIYQ